jgi:uncharacterized protein
VIWNNILVKLQGKWGYRGDKMPKVVLRGHSVTKGKVKGEALVSRTPISFMGGVDPQTGLVMEKGHELEGKYLGGKILVFPSGKGSSAGAWQLYELTHCQHAPRGIINIHADPIIAVGAVISDIAMVDKLDQNPLQVIKTGDLIEIDADAGIVTVMTDNQPKQ